MNDATDVRRSEPATHIINSTHVIHKSTIRIPTLEIIALLKQRGLVIPDGTSLSASFDAESNTLMVSWSTENTDRQTATMVAFPLILPPDPDLTAPEEPDPSIDMPPKRRRPGAVTFYSIPEIEQGHKNAKYHGITQPGYYAFDGPEGDETVSGPFPSEYIAHENFTPWRDSDPARCPKCGFQLQANQRNEPTCFNPACPDPLKDIQSVQHMIHKQGKRRHTCGKDGDPGAVAPLDGRCEACEIEKLTPPNCPKCGNPMATSNTAPNAWTCLDSGCPSLRNWDKDKPIPADPSREIQESIPLAIKRTEADKIEVRAAGRSATIELPASANLQEIVAEVKAAVERQFAKADVEAIAAGLPPAPR